MLLLRSGVGLALASLLFGGACPSDLPRVPPRPAGEDTAAVEATPEPTPTPWVEVYASDLRPYPADDSRSAGAAAVRDGLEAFEDGRWADALIAFDRTAGVAPHLVAWTRGRALAQMDRHGESLAAWDSVPKDSRFAAEAVLASARRHLANGDPTQALELLGDASSTPDDHPLSRPGAVLRADVARGDALRATGKDGATLRAAYSAYKRTWIAGPTSGAGAEAEAAMEALAGDVPDALHPGLADIVARAEALGKRHRNKTIIKLLGGDQKRLIDGADGDLDTACRGTFQLGRAHHKERKYARSVPLLAWAADHCADGETEIKARYLEAQGLSRSGKVTASVAAFTSLADEYPEHSYADDGLHHAARLLAAEGSHAAADALFDRQIRQFADGDMAGDTLWGRAHNALRAGDPADALPHLTVLAAMDPRGDQRSHVLQGRYWHAVTAIQIAPGETSASVDALALLAAEHPFDYYGVLARWKLDALDDERGRAVGTRVRDRLTEWGRIRGLPLVLKPERVFLESEPARLAVDLLRAGLPEEASAAMGRALGDKPHEHWNRDTLMFAAHVLLAAGDPYRGHNVLRFAFRKSWPEPDPDAAHVFAHAYPPAFLRQVQDAARELDVPPLLFQGLVREESAFSPTIVSWAGAIGLSQLMWPTARMTARKMGIRGLRKSHLKTPDRNLAIGTAYFQELHERWNGHLPLAIASYNAGPGAVKRWVDARGDQDLDAWVEAIPYDQTRHYVKRVMGSYQTYNALYGAGTPFVPLRVGPVRTGLSENDPRLD